MTAILPALISSSTISSTTPKGPSRIRSAWNWFRGHIVGPIDLGTRCGIVALAIAGFVLSLLVGNLPLAALFAAVAMGTTLSILLSLLPAVKQAGEKGSSTEEKLEKTGEKLSATAEELEGTSEDLSKTSEELEEQVTTLTTQVTEQKRLLGEAETQLTTFISGNEKFVESLLGLNETDSSLKETAHTFEELVQKVKEHFELFEKAKNGEQEREMIERLTLLHAEMKNDREALELLKKQLDFTRRQFESTNTKLASNVDRMSDVLDQSAQATKSGSSLPKNSTPSNLGRKATTATGK